MSTLQHEVDSGPDNFGWVSVCRRGCLPGFCRIGIIQPYPADKTLWGRDHISANDPLVISCPVVQMQDAIHRYALQLDAVGSLNRNLDGLMQRYRLGTGAHIFVIVGSVKLSRMTCGIIQDVNGDIRSAFAG